eukprot:801301_1
MNMPNLRRIANLGTQFIRHYTNSPQCVPGRTTFFTGRRIDQTKTFNNGLGFGMMSDGKTVDTHCTNLYNKKACERFGAFQTLNYTLLDAMSAIGYDVHLYGKIDVGAGILEMPSQSNSTADGWHEGPSLNILTRSANIDKATKPNPMSITHDNDNNVHHEDLIITQKCQERLKQLAQNNNDDKPWFMYCSINIPHPPFDTNATWLNQVDMNGIPLPYWEAEKDMHPADRYMSISKNVYGYFNESEIQQVRSTYYAMNVETDYLLGNVIQTAEKYGINTSNTIFVFTSDHGEMNMEHRQVWKNSLYEGSSRVPLFFAGPGIEKGGQITNLTQNIDILGTLIELAGGAVPSWITGQSLRLFLDGNSNTSKHTDYITAQYHSNMGNTGSFMVRKDKWKYIAFGHYLNAFTGYKSQLFDLDKDPQEMNDVSTDNLDIVNDMERVLSGLYNYEYVDCYSKRNDYQIFEEFFWNAYNQSELYQKFVKSYQDFNQTDWQRIVSWRMEMQSLPNCTEYGRTILPLSPIT